jgi:phytanoyl-CoA hydroxylase
MAILNSKDLENYRENGFLVLENFVTASACDQLKERAEELVKSFDPGETISIFTTNDQTRKIDDYFLESGDKIRFFFEEDAFLPDGSLRQSKENSINKIGHALHDLDPAFNNFSRSPEIAQLVTDLGYKKPLLLQSMYIFKQPGIGGEVNCHQDSTFLYTEPQSLTGLWFALEDATKENGCLWAIPSGHLSPLKSKFVRLPDGGTHKEILENSPWPLDRLVPLEVSKGTVIVLHGNLPHMSYANRSAKSRHAYTLHIIEDDCNYPAENWLQRGPGMPLKGFD